MATKAVTLARKNGNSADVLLPNTSADLVGYEREGSRVKNTREALDELYAGGGSGGGGVAGLKAAFAYIGAENYTAGLPASTVTVSVGDSYSYFHLLDDVFTREGLEDAGLAIVDEERGVMEFSKPGLYIMTVELRARNSANPNDTQWPLLVLNRFDDDGNMSNYPYGVAASASFGCNDSRPNLDAGQITYVFAVSDKPVKLCVAAHKSSAVTYIHWYGLMIRVTKINGLAA